MSGGRQPSTILGYFGCGEWFFLRKQMRIQEIWPGISKKL
jgi:hypothetical protein